MGSKSRKPPSSKPKAKRQPVPIIDASGAIFHVVPRPQSPRAMIPPLQRLHEEILATLNADPGVNSVAVDWPSGDQESLIKSVRSVIRRNGRKDITIIAKHEGDVVRFWAVPLKKRGSKKAAPPAAP
jgi:hypothetical protein